MTCIKPISGYGLAYFYSVFINYLKLENRESTIMKKKGNIWKKYIFLTNCLKRLIHVEMKQVSVCVYEWIIDWIIDSND